MADPFQLQQMQPMQPAITPEMLGGGAVGGWAGMDMLRDYRQNQDLRRLFDNMTMSRNQALMDTYTQDAPVREAQRGSDIATSRATEATIMDSMSGKAAQEKAKGDVAKALTGSDIEVGKGKAATELDEQRAKRLELMQNELTTASANWQGPDAAAQFNAWADSKNLPQDHPLRKELSGVTPEVFKARLQNRIAHMANSVSSMRSRMEKGYEAQVKGREDRLTQKVVGDWHIRVAEIAASVQRGTANKKDVENILSDAIIELRQARIKAQNAKSEREASDAAQQIQFWTKEVDQLSRMASELSAAKVPPQMQFGQPGGGVQFVPQSNPPTSVGAPVGGPNPGGQGLKRPPLSSFQR